MFDSKSDPNFIVKISNYVLSAAMIVRWIEMYIGNPEMRPYSHLAQQCALPFGAVVVCIFLFVVYARKKDGLATSGPYRFFAHPIYALYILVDLPLWFLATLSPFAIISGIAFYASIAFAMYCEETELIYIFGEDARKHLRRTLSLFKLSRL